MVDYPWQKRFATWWHERSAPRRRILAWPTGSGKNKSALDASVGYERVVIVAPALAVEVWRADCRRWLGEDAVVYDAGIDRLRSREREGKRLTKQSTLKLQQLLHARVVITTAYHAFSGGIAQCCFEPDMLLVLDEGDMYANPNAERSEGMRGVLALYPNCSVLLLTATLFPKEIRDVWNPVQAIFPAVFAPPRKDTGGVPYAFLHKYAGRDPNGYFKGTRQDRLGELRDTLGRVADIVGEDEVLKHVPAVQLRGIAGTEDTYRAWLRENESARSVVLVAWTRAKAEEYGQVMSGNGRLVDTLHGSQTAGQRWTRLQTLREHYRNGGSIGLACTADAFLTSLSLAFFERGLLTQWRTTPRQVVQHLGRYRRPDPDRRVPTVLDLLVEDGQNTTEVQARLAAFQALLGASANAQAFSDALSSGVAAQLNVEFSAAEVEAMFTVDEDMRDARAFFAEEDENDE